MFCIIYEIFLLAFNGLNVEVWNVCQYIKNINCVLIYFCYLIKEILLWRFYLWRFFLNITLNRKSVYCANWYFLVLNSGWVLGSLTSDLSKKKVNYLLNAICKGSFELFFFNFVYFIFGFDLIFLVSGFLFFSFKDTLDYQGWIEKQ